MITVKPMIVVLLATTVALSACAKKEGGLMNLRASGSGPDEFTILPTKTLTQPKSYTDLPEPTPGGANLTDPTPLLDAAAALGGRPKLMTRAGVARADLGLINVVSRYGVAGDIRNVLAREDREFRNKHRGKLLERLFGTTVYFSAYQPQTLDRYRELKRLRRLGVRTSAAPPNTAK